MLRVVSSGHHLQQPMDLIFLLRPGASYVLVSPAWSLLLNNRCTPPTHLVWGGIQPLPPLPTGTRHTGCELGSCSSHGSCSSMGQRVRSCRELVKKGCHKRTEQTVVITTLTSHILHATSLFYTFFCQFSLRSFLVPIPLHIPSSVCIGPPIPLRYLPPSGLQSLGLLAAS